MLVRRVHHAQGIPDDVVVGHTTGRPLPRVGRPDVDVAAERAVGTFHIAGVDGYGIGGFDAWDSDGPSDTDFHLVLPRLFQGVLSGNFDGEVVVALWFGGRGAVVVFP